MAISHPAARVVYNKATDIQIDDAGDYFTDTDVEGALQEIGAGTTLDPRYLKLDQTTPQNVINGAPQFDEGITIKRDKIVYLDGV